MTQIAPPLPSDTAEAQRVEHTRLRRSVIYGMHKPHVLERIRKTVGNIRQEAWPLPDMASNPARHVFSQLAGLYSQVPEVIPPDGGELVAAAISDAGYWQMAQRLQRDTLALNDHLVRVTIEGDGPVFRMVPPDLVEVTTDPAYPDRLTSVREWYQDPDQPSEWIVLLTDPRSREYRALTQAGEDISKRVLGGDYTGAAYPYMVGDSPVLPYIAYHAAQTGYAWDPYTGFEVIDGSLQLGVYYTLLAHVMADASWAQRYVVGVEIAGAAPSDGDKPATTRVEVVTDPATLLQMRAQEDLQGQPVVGQWSAPIEPGDLFDAIERYERRVVEMALGQAGVSRRDSDVRSAMSLAVSRETQREAQRAYEPLFRRSDLQLLRLVSGLMGGPQDGWRINYRALPRDPAELQSETDRLIKQIESGLIDRITAYQTMHPGLTRDEAEARVAEIARINRQYAA